MKFLILGAGPSGLSFANRLLDNGINDFLVLEKEDSAGGLCRSLDVDGSPLDIGGGHFLDVRNEKVLNFLFKYMPLDEWDEYERDSRIEVNNTVINSPIEANIWQMKLEDQVQYLKAIAIAGCNLSEPMPEKFVDWIYWKLGKKIADDYMIPYNQKMFGENLNELGTYWLNKLPNVSFDETLISCLEKKAYGSQPAHSKFYYPKNYGYGELWNRMAINLGEKIQYGVKVNKLNFNTRTVNDYYSADYIINTVPWTSFDIVGLQDNYLSDISSLKSSSVVINYIPNNLDTKAQWIYYPNLSLDYHRILVRHNFCPQSKGYWTETNLTRFNESIHKDSFYYINEYAYPLNTVGKQEKMQSLLNRVSKNGVFGLGRWGEWQHYNSDVVVSLAMDMADKMNS